MTFLFSGKILENEEKKVGCRLFLFPRLVRQQDVQIRLIINNYLKLRATSIQILQ